MTSTPQVARKPAQARAQDLAHWRILLTALAALCVTLGVLWIVEIPMGPLGPFTGHAVTSWLIFVFVAWVVVDVVVRTLDREALHQRSE